MRGKVQLHRLTVHLTRITPAYAGKSICQYVRLNFRKGSPPPMRGKDCTGLVFNAGNRITPAYAGKRLTDSTEGCISWDHPRLCGEKKPLPVPRKTQLGSPPPMRGKAGKSIDKRHKSGITPAYAGKSVLGSSIITPCEDHPRLCGEKSYILNFVLLYSGSPPPMRGKGNLENWIKTTTRITPAYAGKR